jgi:hypothetical protein
LTKLSNYSKQIFGEKEKKLDFSQEFDIECHEPDSDSSKRKDLDICHDLTTIFCHERKAV